MKVSKLIGAVVVKKEAVPGGWVHNSCSTRVVPSWVKNPFLSIERCFSGVKAGLSDARPEHRAEAEGRVGAEISTIHIGIRRVGAVVYPV